ncbi:SDR family NAD(P)-dependent oxidoreductase [Streptomyces sp. NPDC057092]|uniref:SDR family NAD(P)-dependent oxidoreductase n=1 Tax=Streptomyces sp. NPDC057092 TaxID=3346017 RepID=UPI00363A2A8C
MLSTSFPSAPVAARRRSFVRFRRTRPGIELRGAATAAVGDLATDEGAAEVARAAQADGPVDILVNNAGFYRHRSWADASPAEWNDTYNINVVSGVRMIQHLVPAMRERAGAGLPRRGVGQAARHSCSAEYGPWAGHRAQAHARVACPASDPVTSETLTSWNAHHRTPGGRARHAPLTFPRSRCPRHVASKCRDTRPTWRHRRPRRQPTTRPL